jgi:hypothetical protein
MTSLPIFQGLVFDENDQLVEVSYVGEEPCYVVDDYGFQRHISSEYVDRQVLGKMKEMIQGNEDLLVDQAVKMLGQDDIFTMAIIQNQLKQIDQQFETILTSGIPEEGRAYMGMMGFKIIIDVHGDIIRLEQPGKLESDGEE